MIDRRTVTVPRSAVVAVITAVFISVGVLAAIGKASFHQGERLDAIATEGQKQAERNTELLSVECDLDTGRPKLIKGKEYVNSPKLLDAHCAKEKRQAEKIAGYIDTIKTGTADQITVSEGNILSGINELKAIMERRPPPVVVQVPIPRPAPRTSATAPRAGSPAPQKPPAAPPSTAKTAPTTATAAPTTTTCPKRGKSEKCR